MIYKKILKYLLLLLFVFNCKITFSQDDLTYTYDTIKVIDSLKNTRCQIVEAIYFSVNDTLDLLETIDGEKFALAFLKKEDNDSLDIAIGMPDNLFLAGKFLYKETLNSNDEKCDIYNGSAINIFQKERMDAIFSVQMVPNSTIKLGVTAYVLWILYEDSTNLHFKFIH